MNQLYYNQIALSYLTYTILLVFVSFILSITCYMYNALTKSNDGVVKSNNFFIVNSFLLISLLVSTVLTLFTSYLFLIININRLNMKNSLNDLVFFSDIKILNMEPHLSLDFFGSIIICLAFIVGLISLLVSDTRLKLNSTFLFFYFYIFIVIVFGFVLIQNIYALFIFYELLLIPSFLFVLYGSYTTKAVQASLYFVIWTQIGSFLVLASVVYLTTLVGSSDFSSIRLFKFKPTEVNAIFFLLFLGFGIKVPIWPFHYWLTKTHVEAPSGFSIYLSGFLVKTALYGFFKTSNLLAYEGSTYLYASIAFIGVIDASLKMWGQSDLKKIVAYCTIQEMNLIFLLFLMGDTNSTVCGIIFSLAHAMLSSLMFYIVDCVYRKCHSRSVYAVHGLLQQTPNLAVSIIIMCVLYAGLPGTLKFTCEVHLLITLSESGMWPVFLILISANILAVIGFSKNWLSTVFNLPTKELDKPMLDLSIKEIYLISYIVLFFVFFNGLSLFIF